MKFKNIGRENELVDIYRVEEYNKTGLIDTRIYQSLDQLKRAVHHFRDPVEKQRILDDDKRSKYQFYNDGKGIKVLQAQIVDNEIKWVRVWSIP